jgi:hypothetical protein
MLNWTRAHDAWIAQKCEGWSDTPLCGWPNYNTDPAACIRAAEAWRKKGKLRIVRLSLHSRGCSARLYDGLNWINEGPHTEPAVALAQALYRATGGPA